jgi:hypothetical protein
VVDNSRRINTNGNHGRDTLLRALVQEMHEVIVGCDGDVIPYFVNICHCSINNPKPLLGGAFPVILGKSSLVCCCDQLIVEQLRVGRVHKVKPSGSGGLAVILGESSEIGGRDRLVVGFLDIGLLEEFGNIDASNLCLMKKRKVEYKSSMM